MTIKVETKESLRIYSEEMGMTPQQIAMCEESEDYWGIVDALMDEGMSEEEAETVAKFHPYRKWGMT